MTSRFQSVVYLIACSLLGIFLLQVYFGYQVYLQHTATLEKEAYSALAAAVKTVELERVDHINQLFAEDIRNPELAALEFATQDGEPRIFISDPKTGDIHLSIRMRREVDSTLIVKEIQDELISYNRSFLADQSVMYWTDEIGERLAKNMDSIQISKALLEEEIKLELDSLNISSSFQLLLSNDTIAPASGLAPQVGRRSVATKVDGFTSAAISLDDPRTEVLKRTGFVYLMTALVLLLICGSFLILVRLVRREKKLSQLKDDFIDNVTHELLTPITTLQLALASLHHDKSVQKPNKYLDISEQQAQRIAEVTDHILQVSFVDEKHPGLQIEEVNLPVILQEVLDYHQATALKPLVVEADLGPGRVILSDRKHLQNVFHNLIGNAIKYAPEDGVELRVSVLERPEKLEVLIADNGPGIPANESKRIFEKFHRITNPNTHEVKGLGIGLYYARAILQQLQGDIQLKNSASPGATFSVQLPLQTSFADD